MTSETFIGTVEYETYSDGTSGYADIFVSGNRDGGCTLGFYEGDDLFGAIDMTAPGTRWLHAIVRQIMDGKGRDLGNRRYHISSSSVEFPRLGIDRRTGIFEVGYDADSDYGILDCTIYKGRSAECVFTITNDAVSELYRVLPEYLKSTNRDMNRTRSESGRVSGIVWSLTRTPESRRSKRRPAGKTKGARR